MDFQIAFLFLYMLGVVTAIWFIQFTNCIRGFEQSRLNPIPESMMNQYHNSKKYDISQEEEIGYESDSEYEYEEMRQKLDEYLQRYPKVYVRYLEANTEEARQAILEELRHCEGCTGDNVECEHNEAEVTPGILPFDLPPLPLQRDEIIAELD
jgi:hypothetical protein